DLVTGVQTCALPISLRLHHGAVEALRWAWERRTKRALKPGTLGSTVLWTARRELSEQRIVRACRSQAKAAALCRIRQRRRPGLRSEERRGGKEWRCG